MSGSDVVRLRHMLDAAREAMVFIRGRERGDLERDRMLSLALIKEIEIIGEAASKVSPDVMAEHPEIPWAAMVGVRHRLVHAYFDVDYEILWTTAAVALPKLAAKVEGVLAGLE